MGQKMMAFRVDEGLAEAFERYCGDQGFKPYSLMAEMVKGYARAQLTLEAMREHRMSEAGALDEVAALVKHFQAMTRVNGVFRQIAVEAAQKFGVDLQNRLL